VETPPTPWSTDTLYTVSGRLGRIFARIWTNRLLWFDCKQDTSRKLGNPSEIYRGDQRLAARGMLFFVHSLIIMGFPPAVRFYLPKVYDLIDDGNLRFLPVYGRPPELSDQVREGAAVLSQAIYLENYFYLALDGPVPTRTTKSE